MKKMLFLPVSLMIAALAIAQPASAEELTVSAAASLKEAFTAAKTAFEKTHPEVNVLLTFASSNACLRQIQEGAPVDVFASADQETMDKAQQGALIVPETRVDFARNDLVLISPSGSPLQEMAFADAIKMLENPSVTRVAIGKTESVPAGRYAQSALESIGKWDILQPKFIFGQNVRQVLSYAMQGEVDGAFVYRTDALKGKEKVRILATATGHKPILYPAAVCNTGKNAEAGKAFVRFITSAEGQKILADHGFSRP